CSSHSLISRRPRPTVFPSTTLFRSASEIRFVPFLCADEADEGLFDPAMPFRLREVGDSFERLLPHIVLEVVHVEEQDPHGRPLKIGRAHVCTPVTRSSRMPSSA